MRLLAALFISLLFPLAAYAESGDTKPAYVAGKHYQVLEQPVRVRNPEKIEVAEVFSYTCGHCFNFEPLLQVWKKQQGNDVEVVQVPAVWAPQMENFARAYYTAQTLGILEKSHIATFQALHLEKKSFRTAEQWAAFLADFGADQESILKTFNSFGVTSQVRQADARVRGYKIGGTPELVVNGQYRISSSMVGSHEEMLKVADFLISQLRAERG